MERARLQRRDFVRPAAVLALAASVLATSMESHAAADAELFIKRGDRAGVCEAYRGYLSKHAPWFPGACGGRWTEAQHPDISFPNWEQIETLDEHRELLVVIWDFMWERDVNPATYILGDVWRGTKEQYDIAYKKYYSRVNHPGTLSQSALASVDIDNDGRLDNVYLEKNCGEDRGLLIVLNEDGTDIDRTKTASISRHMTWRSSKDQVYRRIYPGEDVRYARPELLKRNITLRESAMQYADYNVFFHGGKTYFDLWWAAHPDFKGKPAIEVGELRDFRAEGGKVTEVCALGFRPASR